MKTSAELKAMATEMSEAFHNGNIAAKIAMGEVRRALKVMLLIEGGKKLYPKDTTDINEAIAMYEAAKTFETPGWQDDKPPYAWWNGKTFDVQYY